VLVQRYRQDKEFYFTLALLSQEGSKRRQDSFDKYREALFPYISRGIKNEEDVIKSILEKAFLQGPFKIKPV
jgi:hypothetical protein